MASAPLPPGVVRAPPIWTLSAEANARRMALVRHRAEAADIVAALVTKHPTPWHGEPVTAAAHALERLASSHGMTTRLTTYPGGCVLEGRLGEQRVGFRARWHHGKADAAWWYDPVEQWATVPDTRPAGVSKTTRTTLAKHRHPGITERIYLVSSPRGVLVPFAQLTARVKALPVGT